MTFGQEASKGHFIDIEKEVAGMCDLQLANVLENMQTTMKPKRMKLWDLDLHWHCAIIGTCLSHAELKKMALKAKVREVMDCGSDYKLHSFMVGQARYGRGVSRLMHKALERKYARVIKAFALAKSNDEVEKLWTQAFERGEIAGPFWAVMTHEHSSLELKANAYGEVHMLSHVQGNMARNEKSQITTLKETVNGLHNELADLRQTQKKAIDKRDHLIGQLKNELEEARLQASRADELEALLLAERDGQSIAKLESRIDLLMRRIIQETDRAELTDQKLQKEMIRHEDTKADLMLRENRIRELEQEMIHFSQCGDALEGVACMKEEGCPGGEDLCGRCIAYIGGQTKQAAFFRDYVERKNGQFIHHDGGLHDGQARLQSILAQADAVMFPVTCISHEASREIKRICQQHKKPFVPLRTQGLGAFTRGLEELSEETFQ